MQHEMMRHPAPAQGSENVGDVLASIRRLIAQDEAGSEIPNQLLNTLPQASQALPKDEQPAKDDQPTVVPLKLDSSDLIAPEADVTDTPEPEATAAPAEMRLHLASTQDEVKAMPIATFLGGNPWRDAIAGIGLDTAEDQETGPEPDLTAEAAVEIDDAATTTTTTDTTNITTPTTAQMEETMLHANASVTPITPVMETQIKLDDALPETGEPHLFARQDKDAQKGTHLRGMIREAIRQELQGEIGNRLSRNLQQMIRHEIELTLRQMCEQE